MAVESIKRAAQRRKYHVRKKVFGTPDRPRLSVFRSNRHMYAQIIDDVAGVTLVSTSTKSKTLRDKVGHPGNVKAAAMVGEAIGKEALNVGINCVCFDRNGLKYHGRTKAVADGARKAGLVF